MDKLFCTLPCLSESKGFHNREIYERLFDKKVDKRHLEGQVRRFVDLNKKMFDFLGIKVVLEGVDNALTLSFHSSNYIGAIPVRMPYDGIAHKDFQVIPRFDTGEDVFSDLTRLLAALEYSISPEFSDDNMLCNPMQLSPPMYYEAMKYVDLFEAVYRYSWRKFDTQDRSHRYPKSSTDWRKYASCSADPRKALIFPAHDSILTTDHREWRELKYVFDIAQGILIDVGTPASIRYGYESKINTLARKVADICPKPVTSISIRTHDPRCVIAAKEQSNIILKKGNTQCTAWRMDMAELFERYVQTVVAHAARGMSGKTYPNSKIRGVGRIPAWGLSYLEPDIVFTIGERLYMADAKYKANYYASNLASEILKETHRADLHQILAYCAFEPQSTGKAGILFYPANEIGYRVIGYSGNRLCGATNKVILCGLPFSIKEMEAAPQQLKEMFKTNLFDGD